MKKIIYIFLCSFVLLNCATSKNAKPASEARLWEYKTKHTNLYSLKDDIELGESVQKKQLEAARSSKIAVDPQSQLALKKRIEKIAKRLAQVSDIPDLPYEVHIYDQPDVANAFCLPGGKMGVFTGLFDKKTGLVHEASDDEIAAVLGHEIAHATLRHVTRRMTTAQSAGVLGSILSVGIGSTAGVNSQQLFDQVFSVSASLYFPSYSRKHETEADKVGFYYMSKAGYNPEASVQIWQRLDDKLKTEGKQSSDFFSSHPSSGKRAEFLRGYLPDAWLVQKQQLGSKHD